MKREPFDVDWQNTGGFSVAEALVVLAVCLVLGFVTMAVLLKVLGVL